PHRTAVISLVIEDQVECGRQAERGRDLQGGAGIGNILDRASELGSFLARDDESALEHTLAWRNPIFVHCAHPPADRRTLMPVCGPSRYSKFGVPSNRSINSAASP